MKTGILITARLGSTRLRRKHLLPVCGQPILHYLIERVKRGFEGEINSQQVMVFIATSDEAENREFEQFDYSGTRVFYGSIDNIPLRHLQLASHYSLDAIIAIEGDVILCSVKGMRAVYRMLMEGFPYVKTNKLPFGMNSFGYTYDFLERSVSLHQGDKVETGWTRIFDHTQLIEITIPIKNQVDGLRFTLDYQEDYIFFKEIIQQMGENIYSATDEEIVNFVLDKELFKINKELDKEYWDNFYKQLSSEKDNLTRPDQEF